MRERPVSLMERVSALETSSQQWRGRVTQSDATKFTVAHKMASSSTSSVPSVVGSTTPGIILTPDTATTPVGSPLLERKKRSPCQKIFKSKTGGNLPSLLNKSSPAVSQKEFKRSISTPNDGEKKGLCEFSDCTVLSAFIYVHYYYCLENIYRSIADTVYST